MRSNSFLFPARWIAETRRRVRLFGRPRKRLFFASLSTPLCFTFFEKRNKSALVDSPSFFLTVIITNWGIWCRRRDGISLKAKGLASCLSSYLPRDLVKRLLRRVVNDGVYRTAVISRKARQYVHVEMFNRLSAYRTMIDSDCKTFGRKRAIEKCGNFFHAPKEY